MSEVPAELRYTPEHEWIRIEGDMATIGVTDYAQDALTDVVWVELPEVGMSVGAMESCGSVESVKSVSEIYAPIAGEVMKPTKVSRMPRNKSTKIHTVMGGFGR